MKNDKTYKIVMTGLMMCLVMVTTWIVKVPIAFTNGYVHLGDAAIFLSVLVLGKKHGVVAAGVGSALADVIGGYAYFAPWTLIVKALMALVMGIALEYMEKKGMLHEHRKVTWVELIAMAIGGIEMAAGYYLVEVFMTKSWFAPIPAIPANIGQFVVGMVLATALASALYNTPAKKYFAFK